MDVPTIPVTTDNAGPSGTKALGPVSLRAVDPHITTAYAHQLSVSIERQLSKDALFAVDYTGSAGENLYTIDRLNIPGTSIVYAGTGAASTRINPQYSTINFRTNGGNSIYEGLNTRFELRNFQRFGLTLPANYTWSHSIDDGSSTFTTDNNGQYNLGQLDPLNPGLDRETPTSIFEPRRSPAVWQEPFFKKPGFANLAMGGWNLSPIFTARSGTPFSIFDETNSDGNLYPRAMFDTPFSAKYTQLPTGRPNEFQYLDLTPGSLDTT